MRLLPKVLAVAAFSISGGVLSAQPLAPDRVISARLQTLAARAKKRSTWEALRSYAKGAKNSSERGFAYFVLGYREFDANDFQAAEADLGESARTGFPLVDFAEYYEARAAERAGNSARAAELLRQFQARYPESSLRLDALEVFARASIAAGRPTAAIQALQAEPEASRKAPLETLLGEAYHKAGQLAEAARVFEEVYYHFPSAAESGEAAEALRELTAQLGSNFPFPSQSTQTARADILFDTGHYLEALKEYQGLLRSNPSSPLATAWTLGQARCLLSLKRDRDAVEVLSGSPWPDAGSDAHRLALLCEAYEHLNDQAAMLGALDELFKRHPQSNFYAAALSRAADFFVRQIDWNTAARYDQALVEEFPQSALARDAGWRIAWADYLSGQPDKARQAMLAHLHQYPDSPHAPAALYWLGRTAESDGSTGEARSLYMLLERRFVNNYYALEASKRLRPRPSRAAGRPSGQRVATLATELARLIPPAPPPTPAVCATLGSDDRVRPATFLSALSLPELAVEYLKSMLSRRPGTPALLLALGRIEADQKNYADALFSTREAIPDYPDYTLSRLPNNIWDRLYPRVYWSLVRRYARADRLDPYLVMGLIRQESAFNPRATSVANARGLMQMRPGTAQAELRTGRHRRRLPRRNVVARELYSPAYNIRMSCRFLRDLLKEFGGNVEETLAAYNAGDNRVNEWLSHRSFPDPAAFVESIPFSDTRVYVESVLRDAVIYRRLMSGTAKFRKCL